MAIRKLKQLGVRVGNIVWNSEKAKLMKLFLFLGESLMKPGENQVRGWLL